MNRPAPTVVVPPRVPATSNVVVRVLGPVVAPRTWLATIHVMFDLIIGVPVFALMVAGLSTTLGLAVTVVLALPFLILTILFARLVGVVERARLRATLGVQLASPHPPMPDHPKFWDTIRRFAFSAAAWKEVAYGLVLLPIATVGFTLVVTAWSWALALLLLPLYVRALPDATAHLWFVDVHPGPEAWLAAGIGLVGILIAPWVARAWAEIDVAVCRALIGRSVTEQLEQRVDQLETTRSYAVAIAEAERRRIERDLHDGAQQRLVALAMDLGMARTKLDSDPEAAKALVDEAHAEAKLAIAELRDLARGIHPVALGDRGLPGAIPALAGRAGIPVDVHVDVPERPPAAIEGIAYFIVSESLTNATKHASASRVVVDVRSVGDTLYIEVADDGIGGARTDLGSGLHGLADRAYSVDGKLTITSPLGGPTIIKAELPCAS